jgi:23S rRNA (uridine2552-2'-O)-methyltransferase
MELDRRFHLLRPGMTVLDLGAAPGSWLQYASQRVGPRGNVIGIDLEEIPPIAPNISVYRADITDTEALTAVLRSENIQRFDLVLSDAAPATSGIKDIDQWRSIEIAQAALGIASRVLKAHGSCIVKVFRGADFDEFLRGVRSEWEEVKIVSVKASRDRSREIYLLLRNRKT